AKGRSRQPFREGEAIQDACVRWCHRRLEQVADEHVDSHAEPIEFVGAPVEAGSAVKMILALAADHDVVAAFADEFIESTGADHVVVADAGVLNLRVQFAAGGPILGAELDPVVAFVAEIRLVSLGAEDEVVARAAEGLRYALAGDDEVAAGPAED